MEKAAAEFVPSAIFVLIGVFRLALTNGFLLAVREANRLRTCMPKSFGPSKFMHRSWNLIAPLINQGSGAFSMTFGTTVRLFVHRSPIGSAICQNVRSLQHSILRNDVGMAQDLLLFDLCLVSH
ncbi:hypothetical protein CDAR_207471 [Caerostris darwini]|uniref:Secreted protein n=1 Tax=Caerostris darwini TaxID=1538125 RepID=A0AAV4VH86_9ARAC|nr:hypothetical protein CDAR_207471 [Caerostris darwini]